MDAKVKEEIPDVVVDRRKSSLKEGRTPDEEDTRAPSPSPAPASPANGAGAAERLSPASPPPAERSPALARLRRFLSALQHFAGDSGPATGDRVKQLIFSLIANAVSVEEFQAGVQECTNYPLRASVPGFLRALVPLAQRDVAARARLAKMSPLQYVRTHEHHVLEAGGDCADIFGAPDAIKRRASDPFHDQLHTNGDEAPPAKRFQPPLLCALPSNASLFDCQPCAPVCAPPCAPPCAPQCAPPCAQPDGFERRDGGISVRDVSSLNAALGERLKADDEWRNIHTMLNCILSMVEKTKRALAILQQRGEAERGGGEAGDIRRAAGDVLAAAARQAEERVADVRRRAEDAVNQVKRQALADLQRAVGAAEARALELAAERGAGGAGGGAGGAGPGGAGGVGRRRSPPPGRELSPNATQNCCWNCGRKAQETCSGCNAARYCGAFCQHKDWESHHQVCAGREQKPSCNLLQPLATSPPSALKPPQPPPPPQPPRSPSERAEARLALASLSERLTSERSLAAQAQSLVCIGGKK